MIHSLPTLVLVPLIALLAPLLSDRLAPWLPVPLVVFEIVLGLLAGPAVLNWAHDDALIVALSQYGLATLFFMAGYEIDFARLKGSPLNRAAAAWGVSLVLGLALGFVFSDTLKQGVFLGTALTTTALGTILPVLRDSGAVGTAFGDAVTAAGAVGEFLPIVAITLFLDGRRPGDAFLILTFFLLLAGVGIWFALRGDHTTFHRLAELTMGTSGQFAVRLVVAVLSLMVAAAVALGVDMLLGAFAAGVIMRVLFMSGDPERTHKITSKLEAISFGFLIPVFFIESGLGFDLDALTSNPVTLLSLPLFLVLFLVVRGVPNYVAAPRGSTGAQRRSMALYGATALPLVVAITSIGVTRNEMKSSTAAALVGAGMLSVLLFPLGALRQGGEKRTPTGADEAVEAW